VVTNMILSRSQIGDRHLKSVTNINRLQLVGPDDCWIVKYGDSDVGDIDMLVTLWWWLISDVGGRIIVLGHTLFGDFFRYVGDFINVLNRSPTSQTCHQHIWSPTSVTNIDVTVKYCSFGTEEIYRWNKKNEYVDFWINTLVW